MPFRVFRHVIAGLALLAAFAASARAQSRIAVLDATGISVLDSGDGTEHARFPFALPSGETFTGFEAAADGGRLYLTAAVSNGAALYVIDASTGENLARIQIPHGYGKAAVMPDGSRAFFNSHDSAGFGITQVDLRTHAVQPPVAIGTDACNHLLVAPDGSKLYRGCNHSEPVSFSVLFSGTISAFGITPSGLTPTPAWTYSRSRELIKLSLTPDGSRLFSGWVFDATTQPHYVDANETQNGGLVATLDLSTRPCCIALRDVYAALLPTRAFVRIMNLMTGSKLQFTEMATGAVITEVTTPGQIVLDPNGNKTYTLQSTLLSRLDNDTGASTPVATGSGWLDAAVLKDQCPDAAVISPSVFTTQGGSGTLTITAPGSCSWTIDSSTVPGLSFNTQSGSGAATIPFTVAATSAPSINTFHVGTRLVTIEQTQPAMGIDEPGSTATQPFLLRGWAIDISAAAASGPVTPTVSTVHVWAWPAGGGAPRFVGAVPASGDRPDIAAAYGSQYAASGFSLTVGGLPTGLYSLVAYAQSARSGAFSGQTGVLVFVLPGTRVAIDGPGPSAPRNFTVSGWAADLTAATGPGVDAVHVWAFPESGAAPIWVGAAAYGGPRDDVAAILGPSFRNSAYWLHGSLPPGRYTLQVFARSTVTGEFNASTAPLTIVPDSVPEMQIDEPAPSATITGTFQVSGWAIDRGAASGTGIDAFHIWAFPTDGSAARFVGVGSPTSRPDVADLYGPQFGPSGFQLTGGSLPAGSYTLAVFGHSTVTNSFSVWRVVTITVQ